MTDKRVTQVAIEQWVRGPAPATWVTQVAAEHWATIAYYLPGAATMAGQAQVAFTGRLIKSGAARMDGLAQAAFGGICKFVGVARMDGQAQATFSRIAVTVSAAHMDGHAQVQAVGAARVSAVARMDGTSAMVAPRPIGAGVAYMNGTSSMVATNAMAGPQTYSVVMSQQITGSGRVTKIFHGMWVQIRHVLDVRQSMVVLTQYGKVCRDHVQLADGTSQKFIWGRILQDAFKVSAAVGVGGIYKKVLAQLFKLGDVEGLSLSFAEVLNQRINLSLSLAGGISLKLLQKFLVATTSSPVFTYHFALAGRVIVGEIFDRYLSAILTQLFTVQPALHRQFIADQSLAQLLTVYPALNNKLVLQIVGDIQLSPEQLVKMIFRGDPLLDGVVIQALYISPSGTTTTWAVNTRTNAVTEYLNYNFRSFALMGNRYIAAGADGLYELEGDTDDGALIISELMSGYLQLNDKKLFGIKGAYIAIRGGGRFYLKLVSGDGREYVYELRAQPNLMTTKVRVGKGISTSYIAFDLVTEGQDFDLDSIEFIPMTRGRRI